MMNLMLTYSEEQRTAFKIFGFPIYWYAIFITAGIIVAFILAFVLCKRKGLSSNIPYEILIAILPLGILTARLFSVLFDGGNISEYFNFRDGGMSIMGAIVGGFVGLIILCLIRKHDMFKLTDILVTVLILAQAIGRWGNYMNGELYGQLITDPAWQFFPFAVLIDGQYYEALFFYESVLNLIGFAVLMCVYWFTDQKGLATGGYLLYYGIVRFFLEPRRQSEYIMKLGNIQISRLLSLVMAIIGLIILIWCIVKIVKDKKGAKA